MLQCNIFCLIFSDKSFVNGSIGCGFRICGLVNGDVIVIVVVVDKFFIKINNLTCNSVNVNIEFILFCSEAYFIRSNAIVKIKLCIVICDFVFLDTCFFQSESFYFSSRKVSYGTCGCTNGSCAFNRLFGSFGNGSIIIIRFFLEF